MTPSHASCINIIMGSLFVGVMQLFGVLIAGAGYVWYGFPNYCIGYCTMATAFNDIVEKPLTALKLATNKISDKGLMASNAGSPMALLMNSV